ncbi:MAG: hypothetical protein ACRDP9_03435 [Kribbellaceae bacterium]
MKLGVHVVSFDFDGGSAAIGPTLAGVGRETRPERIAANADVFDFRLADEDVAALDALDENLVTGWDPIDAP